MKLGWTPRTFLIDTLYYIGGSVLYALGLYTFALNAAFAPGGVSGISIILNHYTGWPIGALSLLLNVPLVILCVRVIGIPFTVRSIWTMLISAFFLDIVFPRLPTYHGNPLLAAMFTGVLMGAGLAVIYMRGSSTGGADFITMSIKKKHPHFSMGQLNLALDAVVILAGGLVFGAVDAVLYGIVATFAATLMMDRLLYGAGSSKMAIIITSQGAAIAQAISDTVGRGATQMKATGTYTGEERDMLLCVCAKNEIYKVRRAARAIDPGSLIMISEVSEVLGEGFAPPPLPGHEDPAHEAQKDKNRKPKP